MATPSITLINLLLQTAEDIETNPDYSWRDYKNCNCGILAKNAKVGDLSILASYGSWSDMALNEMRCMQSNLPFTSIFQRLFSLGLNEEDISNLEVCGSKEVLAELGCYYRYYKDPDFVAAYLRAWARLLDKQLTHETLRVDGIGQQAVCVSSLLN